MATRWTQWACGVLCLAAGVPAALAQAGTGGNPLRLHDTGAGLCVDASGVFSNACAGTGQDGEFGRDVTKRAPKDGRLGFSFTRVCHSGEVAGTGACPAQPVLGSGPNDWGCTRDKVTGLIWEVKTDDGGLRDQHLVYTHRGNGKPTDISGLLAATNAATLCGASDWRLPSYREAQSIVDYGGHPAQPTTLDSVWFPNTPVGDYWTGTLAGRNPGGYWYLEVASGYLHRATNDRRMSVRMVRGTSHQVTERFEISGDEATDRSTGLVWRRCAEGQAWDGSTCLGEGRRLSWQGALEQVRSVSIETGQAWRLPNIKELASVQTVEWPKPLFDPVAFPGAVAYNYWSSTPELASGVSWFVWASGTVDYEFRHQPFAVRLVRDSR